jgi:hypothetical protein
MKKLKVSPVVIICYVLAALSLVYFCYLLGTTYKTIADYYSAYGMKPQFGETVAYILQSAVTPLVNTILLFMAGYILNAVRKLDPNNYVEVEAPAVEETADVVSGDETEDTVEFPAEAETAAAEAEETVEEAAEEGAETAEEVAEESVETAEEAAEEKTESETEEA